MTVREYDAKKKERLYGILRQTPSVLSLAVILFVALSAQASAKTFLRCKIESLMFIPSGREFGGGGNFFTLSFELGEGSAAENIQVKGMFGCDTISNYSNSIDIAFSCAPTKLWSSHKISIDRLSGTFQRHVYLLDPTEDGDVELINTGSCWKMERKF